MPMDIMLRKSGVALKDFTVGDPAPVADPDLITEAAKMLGASKTPMIFEGTGAYDASEEVKTLAEMLQAAVISYQNGRGVVDERHYLAHTNTAGSMLWANCDVAIAIGLSLIHI